MDGWLEKEVRGREGDEDVKMKALEVEDGEVGAGTATQALCVGGGGAGRGEGVFFMYRKCLAGRLPRVEGV